MFCTGGDLKAIESHGPGAAAYVRELLAYLHEALSAIARIPVPVIAGVHGAAAGAGFSLACATDLAIATQSSRFLMAYTNVGLTPDGSSTWYLPRIVGLRRALELALAQSRAHGRPKRATGASSTRSSPTMDSTCTPRLPPPRFGSPRRCPTAAYGESVKRLIRMLAQTTVLETQLVATRCISDACARAGRRTDAKEGLSRASVSARQAGPPLSVAS